MKSDWGSKKYVGSQMLKCMIGIYFVSLTGCSDTKPVAATTESSTPTTTTPNLETPAPEVPRYLYVSSGQCYSGNAVTTFTGTTASNQVFRIATSDGSKDMTIADYYSSNFNAGDTPASLVDDGDSSLFALIENATTGRRIEKLNKQANSSFSIFTNNSTMLSGILRRMIRLSDSSLLLSKSTAIEKMTMGKVRIAISGANPYINSPAGACATSATLLTAVEELGNGNLVFAHAAASPNNKLGIISAGGYAAAGDCKAAQAAPATTGFPTAMVYVKSAKQLIVAYAGSATTTGVNSIQVYDIDETNNTFGAATSIYDLASYPTTYPYLLFGISAMAYDSVDQSLYVATAISTAATTVNYTIEKFTYNSTTKALSRVGSVPFYNYGLDTKCISSLFVGH